MATAVKRRRGSEINRTSSSSTVMIDSASVGDQEALWGMSCSKPAPFTDDPICQRRRDAVDHSIIVSREIAESGNVGRPVRIYADGIYDMFHSGHARQLMQAKCMFSSVYLIVGVCNDSLTYKMKGRTVMNEAERYEAIRHCRYVDELVPSAPWTIDEQFLEKHKIDFVAHDDLPYGAGGEDDIYKWLKDSGRFVVTQRTEGISTTDVITRIIRDYDVYVRRNLARGYTAKEMNVGFMKEKRIQLQSKVGEVKDRIAGKSHELLNKWEEMSREFVINFVELFGRDGRINSWLRESGRKVRRAISPPPMESTGDSSLLAESPGTSSLNSSLSSSPPTKRSRTQHSDDWLDSDDDDDDDENV